MGPIAPKLYEARCPKLGGAVYVYVDVKPREIDPHRAAQHGVESSIKSWSFGWPGNVDCSQCEGIHPIESIVSEAQKKEFEDRIRKELSQSKGPQSE